jgi:hypothetical protein
MLILAANFKKIYIVYSQYSFISMSIDFPAKAFPMMLDQTDDAHKLPVLTVSGDVYHEILLAEGAIVMAAPAQPSRAICQADPKLPDFFAVRRCRLTAGRRDDEVSHVSKAGAALLMRMVGG